MSIAKLNIRRLKPTKNTYPQSKTVIWKRRKEWLMKRLRAWTLKHKLKTKKTWKKVKPMPNTEFMHSFYAIVNDNDGNKVVVKLLVEEA